MGHLVAPGADWGAFFSQSACPEPPEPGAPGAAMVAVATAKGETLWAPFWSRACREDGPKSQFLGPFPLAPSGILLQWLVCCPVACPDGKGPLGW